MKEKIKRDWDKMAIFVFFAAGYLSLNAIDKPAFYLLGILFLVAGLYGLVSLYNKKKFVF